MSLANRIFLSTFLASNSETISEEGFDVHKKKPQMWSPKVGLLTSGILAATVAVTSGCKGMDKKPVTPDAGQSLEEKFGSNLEEMLKAGITREEIKAWYAVINYPHFEVIEMHKEGLKPKEANIIIRWAMGEHYNPWIRNFEIVAISKILKREGLTMAQVSERFERKYNGRAIVREGYSRDEIVALAVAKIPWSQARKLYPDMDARSIVDAMTSPVMPLSPEQAAAYPPYINGDDRINLNWLGIPGDVVKTEFPNAKNAREIIDQKYPGYPKHLSDINIIRIIKAGISAEEADAYFNFGESANYTHSVDILLPEGLSPGEIVQFRKCRGKKIGRIQEKSRFRFRQCMNRAKPWLQNR